ncbi:ferrochelatase [Motiliproteus sp. SC1-56]|uniref:ferrochelatase n=1 Tax=Motiliproteus sp. SC1-56 TaxID=2799565 RepID=UPI001A8CC649
MSLKAQKTAVVLVNLGTPDQPTPEAVRRYLKEFLWDRRVIEGRGPRRWLWWLVLNGIILRLRPRKVAKLYASIWDQDSPMRKILNQQVADLQLALQQRFPGHSPDVFAAMTYGQPGLDHCLKELHRAGYRRVLVMPLYPQYSATSTAPIYDKVARFQQEQREVLDIRVLRDYHDHPLYIEALAESVQRAWQADSPGQKLLLSFHGIPKAYADKGDPYPQQCLHTADLLAAKLGLNSDQYQATFQSRFGPAEWVKPYTDETLAGYPGTGVKSVDVISPAFSADCLETLEEIAVENRDVFMEKGGEQYRYIPALNADPAHIRLLAHLVEEQAGHWLKSEELDHG